MTTSLTIRLPKEHREALRRRAALMKKSESDLVRALIAREIQEASILDRVGHLVGSVDSRNPGASTHPLEKTIRQRNWRS